MDTKHLYSPSTCGFYARAMEDEFVAAGTWPDDLVAVSDPDYDRLMQAPSAGMVVVPGEDGYPVAVNAPEPGPQQIEAMNGVTRDGLLSMAALRIAPLQDAVDLAIATEDEAAELLKWKRYRTAVYRVDISAHPTIWPDAPSK